MFEPMKQRLRKARRDFLRNRIIHNGQTLNELQSDRLNITYEDFPEECDALDTLIDKRGRLQERLLTQFKEA